MSQGHIPVLLKEVIEYLDPKKGQNFIDCTFGNGGHAVELLKRTAPDGKLLGIDMDKEAKERVEAGMAERIKFVNGNFRNLKNIYEHNFHYPITGILFDLGFSSIELDESGRGFSFLRNEPLDMRFDVKHTQTTAAEVLNKHNLNSLTQLFRDYGDVGRNQAKDVALAIVKKRRKKRFETTYDFLEVLLTTIFPKAFEERKITVETRRFYYKGKRTIHPATKYFQALRIEVNKELENITEALPASLEILEKGGRVAVISFHSLEDRIVKNCFRDWARDGLVELITKKPIIASEEEVETNSRSRSAKLRIIEKK